MYNIRRWCNWKFKKNILKYGAIQFGTNGFEMYWFDIKQIFIKRELSWPATYFSDDSWDKKRSSSWPVHQVETNSSLFYVDIREIERTGLPCPLPIISQIFHAALLPRTGDNLNPTELLIWLQISNLIWVSVGEQTSLKGISMLHLKLEQIDLKID